MGCGPSKSGSKLKKVVIIGGGYGGSYLAHLLAEENFCEVLLIEPKEAMLQTHAIPRCVVEPDFLRKVFIPYNKFLGEHQHIRGRVTSINHKKKSLILDAGNKVDFDYLAICSGRKLPFPQSLSDVAPAASLRQATDFYTAFNKEMKRSPEIVIIGGSQFALEVAGELRTDYPDKKVTIITEQKKLLSNQSPDELQAAFEQLFYKKEVDLLLETSVTNLGSLVYNKYKQEQIVKTSGGKEIAADLIIKCDNFAYNTEFCADQLSGLLLDDAGAIKVDGYLRAENCSNIFAFGDAISLKIEKRPENTKKQAELLAANIKNLILAQGTIPAIQEYRSESLPTVVTFGSYNGEGFYNGSLLDEDDKMLARKCLDFVVSDLWGQLKIAMPE